ncbi:MAG: AbrB/MazE/SpoVT family DNA-binding domain-containing protein [Candidatus Baldrarchaeia archaeon]
MSLNKYKTKVLSGYRITIPKEVREKFNIKIGDELEIVVESGKILIPIIKEDPVMMLAGIAEGAPTEIKGDELFLEELKRKVKSGN